MSEVTTQYEIPTPEPIEGALTPQGGNTIVSQGNLQSPSFSPTTGYQFTPNGDATIRNLVASGRITVTAGGVIGGFDIGSDFLRDTADSFGLASTVTGGDDVRLWAGDTYANRSTADFRVTEAGALVATSATITGAITANSGSIGGFTIGSGNMTSNKLAFQGTNERILVGDATAPLAGSGIFIGKDGSDYEFRVGDPNAKYLHYDGATGFNLNGVYISQAVLASLAQGTALEIQQWQFTGVFSATDNDTVAWTAGTLTTSDGSSYAIDAGATGNMVATTYIYFSLINSTTVLQTSATASTAVGAGKILICVANNVASGKDAEFQVFGGTGGLSKLITADNIAADTITANEIAANTITANELTISQLSAIAADLGTITAGNITLNSSGYIKGGQSGYNAGAGFFLGYNSSAYKFSLGDQTKYLTWDGSTLDATGLAYNVVRLAGETIDTSSYPALVFIAKESDTNIASGDIYSQTTTDNYLECYSSLYGTITQSFDVLTDVNYNINKITGVKLKFSKTGSPTGVMPIEIREAAGYGNSYQMTTIASGTIDPATFDGTETEYTITFSSAADIVPGRSYLVLIGQPSTSSNSSNYVRVYYTQNVNYNTGYMSGGADAANLTIFPNYSLYFKVVGERDVKTVIIDKVYNIDTTHTNSFQVDGLAVSSGDEDANIKVRTDGICDGFTGLVSGRKYYYNTTTTYIPAQQTATNTSLILGQAGGSDYKKIGQTFKYIADSNYPTFYSIKVNLSKTGTPSDNVVCKLYKYNNSYTVPTALYTADNVIAGGSVTGSEAEYEFLFSDVALSDGQTYYLELTRSGDSDASNYFRVYYNSDNNLYQNGSLYYNSSGTTMDVQNYDMKFIVTYIPEDTIGYLSTAPNSTYEILVGNAISATEMEIIKTPSFKTRQTLTSGTIYYAYSDGWVTAYGSGATNTYENITGYTDSEPLPTTVAAKFSASTNVFGGISFPVKKGDYYKFVQSGDDTVLAYFNPNN